MIKKTYIIYTFMKRRNKNYYYDNGSSCGVSFCRVTPLRFDFDGWVTAVISFWIFH